MFFPGDSVNKHGANEILSPKLLAHDAEIRWAEVVLTKSSSAAGRTRRRIGNTSTCQYGAFRHITKSSVAAGLLFSHRSNISVKSLFLVMFLKSVIVKEYSICFFFLSNDL